MFNFDNVKEQFAQKTFQNHKIGFVSQQSFDCPIEAY
jgi:hypothetical protein